MKWHLTAASLAFGNTFWTHHHKLHSGHFSKAIPLFKKENIPKEKWIPIRNVGIQKKMIIGVQECSTEDSCIPFSQIPIGSLCSVSSCCTLKVLFKPHEWFSRVKQGTKPWQHSDTGTVTLPLAAGRLPLVPSLPPHKDTLDTCSESLRHKDDISQRTLKSQLLIKTCFRIRSTLSVVLARWSRQGEASHGWSFDLLDTVIAFWDERTKMCVKILMANV